MIEGEPKIEKVKQNMADIAKMLQQKLGDRFLLLETGINKSLGLKVEGSFFSKEISQEDKDNLYKITQVTTEMIDEINKALINRKEKFRKELEFYEKRNEENKIEEMKSMIKSFDFQIVNENGSYKIE